MNNIILPPLTGYLIQCRFHGPTDHKSSRISASLRRDKGTVWRVYSNWQHNLNPLENHFLAANKLLNKYWSEDQAPVIVSAATNHPDFHSFIACGDWQFSCAAAWLTRQREAAQAARPTS